MKLCVTAAPSVAACAMAMILIVGLAVEAIAAPTKLPNVLVIIADDLGFHDVGYHGSEISTPNLDRMAAAGARLEQYYVFPTCSPTRCALLTSRNPARFGVMGPIGGRSEQVVPPETTTLADVLKSRGYVTAITGKWHLSLSPRVGPRNYGFDSTYGYLHGQIDPHTHLYKNGDRTWHRNDVLMEEQGHATDLITAEAIRQIEAKRAEPFFVYVAYSVPHVPIVEEARWMAPYEGKIANKSRLLFAASVTHMDDSIGQILAALDRSGQRDNTLIIFTSDNGGQQNNPDKRATEYNGMYGAYDVLGDNTPLRGWKGETYEGGIRVPGIAVWPGVLAARDVTAALSVLDWLPTLAAITGASTNPDWKWEGLDIRPQLEGKPGVLRRLYWNDGSERALRDGDWKLIEQLRGKQPAQLFNLAADPNEKHDEAKAQPEIVARLHGLLDAEAQPGK